MAPTLAEAANRALAEQGRRVAFFPWNGAEYVIKQVEAKPRGRIKNVLLAILCRLVFPGHVLAGEAKPGDGWFEARRIRDLGKAGMRVPRVVLELPDAVVYTHCGPNLRLYLSHQPAHIRASVVIQAMDDLAVFHGAGHWHGGSQFRNILVPLAQEGKDASGGGFYRIDFEEDLADRFSLPLLQMYDLCLFLMDALSFAPDQDQATDFGMELLLRYRRVCWSLDHMRLLRRMARLLRPLLWLGTPLGRRKHHEVQRTLALAKLLVLASADTKGGS